MPPDPIGGRPGRSPGSTDRLAIGLAGLVNLFNPDRIVLGGLHAELLRCQPDRLAEGLRERSFLSAASEVPIAAGTLDDDAVLLGAAELALQSILDHPREYSGPALPVGR